MKLVDMLTNTRPDLKIYQNSSIYIPKELIKKVKKMISFFKQSGIVQEDKLLVSMEHNINGIAFLAAASAMGLQVYLNYNLESQTENEVKDALMRMPNLPLVLLSKEKSRLSYLKKKNTKIIELWKAEEIIPDKTECEITKDSKKEFLVLFTSGSSGKPKAISLSEDTVCKRIMMVTRKLEFTPSSVIFLSGLLSNTTGIIFSFGAFLNQADLVIPNNRDINNIIFTISTFNVTHIMLRPAMMEKFANIIASKSIKLPSLKVLAYGAAAMPEKTVELGRKYLNCKWIQGYGLSETFGPFIWLDEEAHLKKQYKHEKYCIGISDGSLTTRIVPIIKNSDVGEMEVSGSVIMNGYLDMESNLLFPVNTWFKTGDVTKVGIDGLIYLKGRISDTILTRDGHCTYPEEIEAIVGAIEGIEECFLTAGRMNNQSEITGTILCVYAKKRKMADIIDIITKSLEKQISKEKWPDWIYFSREAFTRSSNEKIKKQQIFDHFQMENLYKFGEEENL